MKVTEPIQLTTETTLVVLEDTLENRYTVKFAAGENLMLVCGQDARKPIAKKLHELIMKNKMTCSGVVNALMEFKHCRRSGSKFWTSCPGKEFYFCVPKSQIKLLPVQGLSYVRLEINGVEVILNVSGGTTYEKETSRSGWGDWVSDVAHTFVGMPLKKIKAIAEVAIPAGTPEGIKRLDANEQKKWEEMVNDKNLQAVVVRTIAEGNRPQIILAEGFSMGGNKHGVADSVSFGKTKRVKDLIVLANGYPYRIKPSQVDWEKSAALFAIPA